MKQYRRTQTALVSHDPERLNRLLGLISRPSAPLAAVSGARERLSGQGRSFRTFSLAREWGEMGARIRAFDWERSPLGPISSWSHSLKGTVELMMRRNSQ
jgi:hypothetical protein